MSSMGENSESNENDTCRNVINKNSGDAIILKDEQRDTPNAPTNLLGLIECLSSTTNSIELQIIINKYLQKLMNTQYAFLVPILPSRGEGVVQVINENKFDKEIRFSVSFEHFIEDTDNDVQVSLIEPNKQLADIVKKVVGDDSKTLFFYIRNAKKSSQIRNSLRQPSLFIGVAGEMSSCELYIKIIQDTFRYILGHLLTAIELFEEKMVRKQNQNLLHMARGLLTKLGDLAKLLKEIMTAAKDMTNAERCSLFLIDQNTKQLVSIVFDNDEAKAQLRIDEGLGVAGHVAKSGKLLNIKDAYQEPLFYKGIDEITGFRTRNILSFPICDENGIIGVAELCNKKNDMDFDELDEQLATAFSVYCGVIITHSIVHEKVQKAEARHKLSQELLTYHMHVTEEEVDDYKKRKSQMILDVAEFSTFKYNPRETDFEISIELSLKMFADLKFIEKFQIDNDRLMRFLLIVRKGYRAKIPYHNWTHGFAVAHFSYALMMNLKLIERGYITELQGLALLIASFCHDLDHRGTDNSFQLEAKSSLARLYSSEGSVNERHHLAQTLCLLNEEKGKILDGLNTRQFKECIDLLRHIILSTDLANHFRILSDLRKLTAENLRGSPMLFLSLLITCADLSDQTMPWQTTLKVSNLLYAEFFAQGDLERQMGILPTSHMDRQNACIPKLQIEFLSAVVLPTFEILCNLFPEIANIVSIIHENKQQWELLDKSFANCI